VSDIAFCAEKYKSRPISASTSKLPWASGLWRFLSIADLNDVQGYYGTKGVPSSTNIPGAREGAATWIDASNNLWLFAGKGCNDTGGGTELNDLWKFDTSLEQWIWVGGSKELEQFGVYGTKGVPASTNCPGARRYANSWVDASGNLWLFGGFGFATKARGYFLNDLWKYDVAADMWTWMAGTNLTDLFGVEGTTHGVYGTKGVPASANTPGARYKACSWTDASGNLWLFGGLGFPESGASETLSDLWKFDISTGLWTWVSGPKAPNQYGNYGTKGVAHSDNTPGARDASQAWTDSSGTLWLFGGQGYAATSIGQLNDLWKFEITADSHVEEWMLY